MRAGGALTGLRRDRRGVAALETAITMAFLLLPLLSGIAGAGQALMTQQRLDRALHAALMLGWGTGATSAADLKQAAQDGYGTGGAAMTPDATVACYCLAMATGVRSNMAIACGASCANGEVQGTYATVTATASFTPILGEVFGSAAWNLSASGTARIK